MLQVVKNFEDKGIELISLRENIDISTVTGRCFLSIMDIGKDSNKKHTDAYDIGALAFVSSVSAPLYGVY
jgi:hypothetical protein